MAAKHLKQRKNWQTETNKKAKLNENKTYQGLSEFLGDEYAIAVQPRMTFGLERIQPELCIENLSNGKKIILDDKHGENGGNAHERLYGYYTPGLTTQFEKQNCIALGVLSGRTFSAPEPFTFQRWDKKKQKHVDTKVNPERYRKQLQNRLPEGQYFIVGYHGGYDDLAALIKKLLS